MVDPVSVPWCLRAPREVVEILSSPAVVLRVKRVVWPEHLDHHRVVSASPQHLYRDNDRIASVREQSVCYLRVFRICEGGHRVEAGVGPQSHRHVVLWNVVQGHAHCVVLWYVYLVLVDLIPDVVRGGRVRVVPGGDCSAACVVVPCVGASPGIIRRVCPGCGLGVSAP